MVEVDDYFFATVEGVGDYGVFREIGAERVLVFESDVVVARNREVDVECACAIGFLVTRLLVASYADTFYWFVGLSGAHFTIDATVEIVAIVRGIACLKYECYRRNSKSTKYPTESFAV